jgi:hypothetical protein
VRPLPVICVDCDDDCTTPLVQLVCTDGRFTFVGNCIERFVTNLPLTKEHPSNFKPLAPSADNDSQGITRNTDLLETRLAGMLSSSADSISTD